jgi:thiol:disulfide interchange protein DsbD
MIKNILLAIALVISMAGFSQSSKQVKWDVVVKKQADKLYEVHITANLNGKWHLYSQNAGIEGPLPTVFTFSKNPLLTMEGPVKEIGKMIKKKEEVWDGVVNFYEGKVEFVQLVKLKGNLKTSIAAKVEFMVCNDAECLAPSDVPFNIQVGGL